MHHRLPWLIVCTALCGCFNPTGSVFTSSSTGPWGPSTSDTSSGSTGANSTGTPPGSTSSPPETSTSSTGALSTSSTTGACGDSHVDDGEECDDGPLADGCSSSCKAYRTVFVTSQVFTGDLGGLAGADAKCQDAATAAALPGTYLAWLSSSTESPQVRFVHSSIPYRLLNGTDVAGNWSDLTDGSLDAGINVSELNGPPGRGDHSCVPDTAPIVWTNTSDAGDSGGAQYACAEWAGIAGSGSAGLAGSFDFTWTTNCIATCGDEAALYCVEQ